jgi:hypothetical protein
MKFSAAVRRQLAGLTGKTGMGLALIALSFVGSALRVPDERTETLFYVGIAGVTVGAVHKAVRRKTR